MAHAGPAVAAADACNRPPQILASGIVLSIQPSFVEQLRRILLTEGFNNAGLFQVWKRGQIFGYVRRVQYDLEWHIRAFADGRLESELEPPRTTINHLLVTPRPSDDILAQLLSRHRISFTRQW